MKEFIENLVNICPIIIAVVGFVLNKFIPYVKTKIVTKKYYNFKFLFVLIEYELLATFFLMIVVLILSVDFEQLNDNYIEYNINYKIFILITILYVIGICLITKFKHEKGVKRYIGNIILGVFIYMFIFFPFFMICNNIYEEKFSILLDGLIICFIILQILLNVEIEKVKNITYKIFTKDKKYKTIVEPIKKGKYYYVNLIDRNNNIIKMVQLPEEKVNKIIYEIDNLEEDGDKKYVVL